MHDAPDAALADAVFSGYLGMPYDPQTEVYLDAGRRYDPLSGRYLSEDPRGHASGETNLYRFAQNTPVNRNGAGLSASYRGGGDGFWSAFGDHYSRAVNPVNQWEDGNYGMAVGQGLGWVAFTVGTMGLGAKAAVALGVARAGFAGVSTYFAIQGAKAGAETAVEAIVANGMGTYDQFSWGASFGKNFWVNSVTGGIGGTLKTGGRLGAFALRQGIEIAGDTAIDAGVYGNHLGSALAWNTVGSLGGEAIFTGLTGGVKRGWRFAADWLESTDTLSRVAAVGGRWSSEAPLNSRVATLQKELKEKGVVQFTRKDRLTLKEIGNISSGLEAEIAITRVGQTRYMRLLDSHSGEVPMPRDAKLILHTHPASGYAWGGLDSTAIGDADFEFLVNNHLRHSAVVNEYGWWRVFKADRTVGRLRPNP